MSLKDEFQKIIQSEQRKLEEKSRREADYREVQRLLFRPIRVALVDLVEAFGDERIGADIYSDKAVLYFKKKSKNTGKSEIFRRWFIQPSIGKVRNQMSGDSEFHSEKSPEVKLIQTIYFEGLPSLKRTDEYTFGNQIQAFEFLVKEATAAIAQNHEN